MLMQEARQIPHEILDFCDFWLRFKPKPYQEKFLNACCNSNRIAGIWCRQSGKSTSVAAYCLYETVIRNNNSIMIIAPTQEQSAELYRKIRLMFESNDLLREYLETSTATELIFKNNSRIKSLPCGPEGITIRGYTADTIILEEAGYIKDSIVNEVIIPMIAAKPNGKIIKIGTPKGRTHFYQSCYGKQTNYQVIHVGYEEVIEAGLCTKEFIEEQRNNLTIFEFANEYEARFIEIKDAYFTQELIWSCVEEYPMMTEEGAFKIGTN